MDIEKAMAFIVEQQAKFAAGIQELLQNQKENDERWAKNDERWAKNEGRWEKSDQRLIEMERVLGKVINTVDKVAEMQLASMARIAEIDERLDSLIIAVERHISGQK